MTNIKKCASFCLISFHKPMLLLFILCSHLGSCKILENHISVERIDLYGMPLGSSTKLGTGQSSLLDSSRLITAVNTPHRFLARMDSALSSAKEIDRREFGDNYVRMVYRIYKGNKIETIAIDQGGTHIMFNDRVYLVNKNVSNVIVEYMPKSEDDVLSPSVRYHYKVINYTPYCCRD